MSAGFMVDGQVFWGTNGAVEDYVIALADLAADRLGPDHPLSKFLADQRDGFHSGAVVRLDRWLESPEDRRRFLDLLDAATARIRREGTFTAAGREWIATTVADLRDEIAGDPPPIDEPKPEPKRFGGLDALQVVFGVAACSGVFFTISGPAKNTGHLLFRLGVMGVGCLGLLVVTILKLTRQRRP
jgi:hypothetical protein